jgi:hypothetical protein
VEPPKFDGAIFWAVFRRQFEAAAVQNNWTPNVKATYFLSVLQGQAAGILHTTPTEAMYDGIVGVLRDPFGDHQLAAAYRVQMSDVTL